MKPRSKGTHPVPGVASGPIPPDPASRVSTETQKKSAKPKPNDRPNSAHLGRATRKPGRKTPVWASVRERDVLSAILSYCAVHRIFVQRRNTGAAVVPEGDGRKRRFIRYNKRGMADLWLIVQGRHIECEIKAPGKKPSDEQMAWLGECAAAGAVAFWCDSLDGFIAEMRSNE